jgi:type I restriction enzyme M protein
MVNNSMVDCIVRLPDKLFLTTGIPACIFILSRTVMVKMAFTERNNEIYLSTPIKKNGTMESHKLRVFYR